MHNYKEEILDNLCYTELVYGRINKKLKIQLSNGEIETFITETIKEVHPKDFIKTGKNIYISNHSKKVRLTINSFTFRIITADIIK